MGPLAQSDGHDFPWLIEEIVPNTAAVIDEIFVGLKMRFHSQLSRMNCQFSTGLSLGDFGGSATMVTLGGTTTFVDMCQPA